MIVLYRGKRGSGKNLSMTKDSFIMFKNGYKILANYKLSFGEHIDNVEVLNLNKDSNLYDCVLVLDEIQLFFDSRNFAKESNKNFSNFLQQIRKRNIHILCATQYSNAIDLRLRQHIDIVAFPEFDKITNICKVRYFDLTKLEDIEVNPFIDLSPVTILFDARQVFSLFDTKEMLR